MRSEPAHSPLTAREAQVAELVEHGMKNRDIAATLGISTGTVKITSNTFSRRPAYADATGWLFRA